MKELRGFAETTVEAGVDACLALLRDVEHYPSWFGERVREVVVVERGDDDLASVARATLRVEIGPFAQDVHVLLRVTSDEDGVTLTRVPHEPSDSEELVVRWDVAVPTVRVSLAARLDVPRLLPVGGVGDSLAAGFVQAAARALADGRGSSSNTSASSS